MIEKINRNDAVVILSKKQLVNLDNKKRESYILDWWGIDKEDEEFFFLSSTLQKELLNSDEIPKDIENDLESYIQASQLYHTLIISEKDGWAEQGIHINFYIRDDKVRFEINVESLKKSGLKAESMLLDYARIVKTKTN